MSIYRNEYKYIIDERTRHTLITRISGVLQQDSHATEKGYLVRSLYFDDIYDTCLNENEAGTNNRAKYRIRYYDNDIGFIRLEKKIKINGLTGKESCSITIDECKKFMSGIVPTITDTMEQEKVKLFTEMKLRGMRPRVIVEYKRVPFVYAAGNVRITFDYDINSSAGTRRFLEGDYERRPVLTIGNSIMEVKWDEIIPRFVYDTLQVNNLAHSTFSKYYMCRKYHLR